MTDPRKKVSPGTSATQSPGGVALFGPDAEPPELLEDDELLEVGRSSLVGNVIADRYEIQYELGAGGMGVVYYAEHVLMRKPVAVKVLRKELMALPEVVARFEREAIAAGRINDPHVIAATDFGRLADGSFYLALEYVEGTSLAELIASGPLPVVRALKITRQILKALAAAHTAGVVHRDLKPENVMLVKRADEPDFVKVLDFGIAKIGLDEKEDLPGGVLTRMGSVFGTPQYMAPEQAAGQEVDQRVDLYTVGIILYEMLAGKVPFMADEVGRVLAMHLTQPVPPLPEEIGPKVAAYVMALLEKTPADRVPTAEEALQRLDQVLTALGVSHPSFAMFSLEELGSYHEIARSLAAAGPGALAPGAAGAAAVSPGAAAAPGAPPAARSRPMLPFLLGAAAVLVIAVPLAVFVTMQLTGRSGAAPSASAAGAGSAPAGDELTPELAALLAHAANGERDALRALEARPAASRSAQEWAALGRGRMATGRLREGVEAYDAALTADQTLAADRGLIAQVREAARHKESSEPALHLAARRLGSAGADLLYDVWVATKLETPETQLAKRLVYEKAVRDQASPALDVALELRAAKECEDYTALLPKVSLHGDSRAGRVLQKLAIKVGCGPKGREDCYPCLRTKAAQDAFEEALIAARNRSAPSFIP